MAFWVTQEVKSIWYGDGLNMESAGDLASRINSQFLACLIECVMLSAPQLLESPVGKLHLEAGWKISLAYGFSLPEWLDFRKDPWWDPYWVQVLLVLFCCILPETLHNSNPSVKEQAFSHQSIPNTPHHRLQIIQTIGALTCQNHLLPCYWRW